MSQYRGLLRITTQVLGTPGVKNVFLNWPLLPRLPGTFGTFSSVPGKIQFCRGDGLEEQLQLIAASESHLSFIFAICRFCSQQHCNQNLQKRKQARLGLCWTICSSFFLLIRPSFSHLKTFAQESKIYAKGKALTESSSEFVLWAASAPRSTNFNPSSHSLKTSPLTTGSLLHTPDRKPGTRMSWGITRRKSWFPNRAAGSTNRKNSQSGGWPRRHCVQHGPASPSTASFGLFTTLCLLLFLAPCDHLTFWTCFQRSAMSLQHRESRPLTHCEDLRITHWQRDRGRAGVAGRGGPQPASWEARVEARPLNSTRPTRDSLRASTSSRTYHITHSCADII